MAVVVAGFPVVVATFCIQSTRVRIGLAWQQARAKQQNYYGKSHNNAASPRRLLLSIVIRFRQPLDENWPFDALHIECRCTARTNRFAARLSAIASVV